MDLLTHLETLSTSLLDRISDVTSRDCGVITVSVPADIVTETLPITVALESNQELRNLQVERIFYNNRSLNYGKGREEVEHVH